MSLRAAGRILKTHPQLAQPSLVAHRRARSAAIALVLLLWCASARAQVGNYFDEFAASTRTGAMGQAFTGIADDPTAAFYNPGGLGFAEDQTYLGWHYTKPDLELDFVDPAETDPRFQNPATRGLSVGSSGRLATEGLIEEFPWLDAVRWGGAVFLSLPQINSFRSYADETTPYFFRYDTRPDVLSIAISFGWQALDWLSIGAGVLTSVSSYQTTVAQVRIGAVACPIVFPEETDPGRCDELFPDDPTHGLDLALKQRLPVEITPVVGTLVRIPFLHWGGDTTFGFSWRGAIENDFGTGPQQTTFGYRDPSGLFVPLASLPTLDIINFIGFAPEQFNVGLGIRPTAELTIGIDGAYKRWEEFRLFKRQRPDPAFENTLVGRVGIEQRIPWKVEHWLLGLERIDLRAGYYYEPTPNPSLNGTHNVLDMNQHVVAGGIGIGTRFMDAALFRLDLFYQAHLMMDRFSAREDDPVRGAYEISGRIWSVGIEGGVDW